MDVDEIVSLTILAIRILEWNPVDGARIAERASNENEVDRYIFGKIYEAKLLVWTMDSTAAAHGYQNVICACVGISYRSKDATTAALIFRSGLLFFQYSKLC